MKYIFPLLLAGTVQAAEIESVSIGTNTMLVQGSGLSNIQRVTLARKPVKFLLFKPLRKLIFDVTVTGQELSGQPELPPSDRPQPAG